MPVDEMSFVITTLDRINNKLDKHDDKIDMIVQAMQQLVKVDTENKEIKESLTRAFKRLEDVERNQTLDGCPAHKNFIVVRNEQVKKYDALILRYDDMIEKYDKRIEILEQKPLKAIDKVFMALLGAVGTGIGGWILLKFGVSK